MIGNDDLEGIRRITDERMRQIESEGYTPEHDVEHGDISLLLAAQCYVDEALGVNDPDGSVDGLPGSWPWEPEAFKPSDDPVRNLEKAGALIAAEIDRLMRKQGGRPSGLVPGGSCRE